MRFIRDNGKFYAVLKKAQGTTVAELSFRELTVAMADIASLIETHVTVTEDAAKFDPNRT